MSKQDPVEICLGMLIAFIVGAILALILITYCRPMVTKWSKLPQAPAVEVPTEIVWKGAKYDCILKDGSDMEDNK